MNNGGKTLELVTSPAVVLALIGIALYIAGLGYVRGICSHFGVSNAVFDFSIQEYMAYATSTGLVLYIIVVLGFAACAFGTYVTLHPQRAVVWRGSHLIQLGLTLIAAIVLYPWIYISAVKDGAARAELLAKDPPRASQ